MNVCTDTCRFKPQEWILEERTKTVLQFGDKDEFIKERGNWEHDGTNIKC